MKSIVENLLDADAKRNVYIHEQMQSMFTKYGPDTVIDSSDIMVADFGQPASNADLQKILSRIADDPALARKGKSSPFQDRGSPFKNTPGLYVILTDYQSPGASTDGCTFKVGGLTAIYRGESDKVRERTLGHIFRNIYNSSLRENQVPWPNFMTVDSNNGINIDQGNYAKSKWMVIVYPLPKCGSHIRRQAELAFDAAFGKPSASTN